MKTSQDLTLLEFVHTREVTTETAHTQLCFRTLVHQKRRIGRLVQDSVSSTSGFCACTDSRGGGTWQPQLERLANARALSPFEKSMLLLLVIMSLPGAAGSKRLAVHTVNVVLTVGIGLFHLFVGQSNVLPHMVYQWPCMCSVQRAVEASRSGTYSSGSMTVSDDPPVRKLVLGGLQA